MSDSEKISGSEKKNIIIYGVGNASLRAKVNAFLSPEYRVLGVSDTYVQTDFLQNETFIEPSKIYREEYDWILLMSEKDAVQKGMYEYLVRLKCKPERVIVPRLLIRNDAEYIPNLKAEITTNEELPPNIIMGLSYSLRGIDLENLNVDCFDFSWHGLDLYYNYKSLETYLKMRDISKGTAILCFPYYYFNYDMSNSPYQFKTGQILACHGFNDWHNAYRSDDGCIKEYLLSNELFGEKFWKYKKWKKIPPKNDNELVIKEVELSNVWKKYYKKTFNENISILEKILKLLSGGTRVVFVIPPIYRKIIRQDNMQYYNFDRELYYNLLNKVAELYSFEILDFSDVFSDEPILFYDFEHLNERGRIKFTSILNEYIFKNS